MEKLLESEVEAEVEKSETLSEEQENKSEKAICSKCGYELAGDLDFCPKCGKRRETPSRTFCTSCGAEFDAAFDFCPSCGNGVKSVKKKRVNPVIIIVPIVIALIAVAITLFFVIRGKQVESISLNSDSLELDLIDSFELVCDVIPYDAKDKTIIWSSSDESIVKVDNGVITPVAEGYCTITATSANGKTAFCEIKIEIPISRLIMEGDYREAYARAEDEQKEEIVTENLIAYLCSNAYPSMKDPDSFGLRNAWYDKSEKEIVLQISGSNSYGGTVSQYWYYKYLEGEYVLYTTMSDFDHESYYSWDDTEDIVEKILENAAKDSAKKIVKNESKKISSTIVDNINQLFENKKLKDVELLPEDGADEKV